MGPRTKSLWMVAKGAHARGYPRPDGGLTLRDTSEIDRTEILPVAVAGAKYFGYRYNAQAEHTTSWILQWLKKYDQYRFIAITVVYKPTWGPAVNIIGTQTAMNMANTNNYLRPFIEFAYQIDYDSAAGEPNDEQGWLTFIDNPRTVHIREWARPVVIRYRPRVQMPIYRATEEGGNVYVPVYSNPWLDTKALNIPHYGHHYKYKIPHNQFTTQGGLAFKIKYYFTIECRTMLNQTAEMVTLDPEAGAVDHPMDAVPEPNEPEET